MVERTESSVGASHWQPDDEDEQPVKRVLAPDIEKTVLQFFEKHEEFYNKSLPEYHDKYIGVT